jgi:hypothetical protein
MFLACCIVGQVHVIQIDCAGGGGWGCAVMVVVVKVLHHVGEET